MLGSFCEPVRSRSFRKTNEWKRYWVLWGTSTRFLSTLVGCDTDRCRTFSKCIFYKLQGESGLQSCDQHSEYFNVGRDDITFQKIPMSDLCGIIGVSNTGVSHLVRIQFSAHLRESTILSRLLPLLISRKISKMVNMTFHAESNRILMIGRTVE